MQTRYNFLLKFVLAFSDLAILNGVFIATSVAANHFYFLDTRPIFQYYLPVVNLLWLLSAGLFRLYMQATMNELERIYRATWRAAVLHAVLFSAYLYIANLSATHTLFFLTTFYISLAVLLILSRLIGTYIQGLLIRHFRIRKTVAIIGENEGGKRLAHYFRAHEKSYAFEGYLSEPDTALIDEDGNATEAALIHFQCALDRDIKEVYISLPPEQLARAGGLLKTAERYCLRVKIIPDLSRADNTSYEISVLGSVPVISIRQEPTYEIEGRFKKRLFDLVFSTVVIVLLLSWLYPILALLIKLDSRGPVLFKQLRSGRDNKAFVCYKFRSMHVNADSDRRQATRNDDRTTRVGRFLRKTSLDELPQFFNVWLGHMSVIGPRPHMLKHTEQYSALIDGYMARQFLKPGITGWAQVNGYRGEITDPSLMERRVAHDIWYLENWTAMLDVRIVFLTIIHLLTGDEHAY